MSAARVLEVTCWLAAAILAVALTPAYQARQAELGERVRAIVERHPVYEELSAGAAA